VFKIKYYQSLTLEEKEYIQNELDKIDYFFKEELSKKDFKTLDYISKQSSVGDYEFLISINNNSGFISGVYNNADNSLTGITIVNFNPENKFKFYNEILKCLELINEKLEIKLIVFDVFKNLDYVVTLDEKLCKKFNLEFVSKVETDDFYRFTYKNNKKGRNHGI